MIRPRFDLKNLESLLFTVQWTVYVWKPCIRSNHGRYWSYQLTKFLFLFFIYNLRFLKRDPIAKWDDNRKFELKSKKKIVFIYLFYSSFLEISILVFWTRYLNSVFQKKEKGCLNSCGMYTRSKLNRRKNLAWPKKYISMC